MLIGAGTVLGLIVALLGTSALRSVLYEVSALDLSTFLFVTFTLALVALAASYIPARRATRADPMKSAPPNRAELWSSTWISARSPSRLATATRS